MSDHGWVPLHIRMQGVAAADAYRVLREEPSLGMRDAFQRFFAGTLGKWDRAGVWKARWPRWSQLARITRLEVVPFKSDPAEVMSKLSGIEMVSAAEVVFATAPADEVAMHSAHAKLLNQAMIEDCFAWQFAAEPPHAAQRRLSPGLDALIEAARRHPSARDRLAEALRLTAGTKPNPAMAVIEIQKAVEAVVLKGFGMEGGSLGMLIGEIRKGNKKLNVPRSPKALEPKLPPFVDPNDTLRGIIEAVHFGNPERHAGGPDQPPLTTDQALNLLGLASIVIDWFERGQVETK